MCKLPTRDNRSDQYDAYVMWSARLSNAQYLCVFAKKKEPHRLFTYSVHTNIGGYVILINFGRS